MLLDGAMACTRCSSSPLLQRFVAHLPAGRWPLVFFLLGFAAFFRGLEPRGGRRLLLNLLLSVLYGTLTGARAARGRHTRRPPR